MTDVNDVTGTVVRNKDSEINAGINEIVLCYDRIQSENEQIKAITQKLKDAYNVNPKILKKIAKDTHSGKTSKGVVESQDYIDTAESYHGTSDFT